MQNNGRGLFPTAYPSSPPPSPWYSNATEKLGPLHNMEFSKKKISRAKLWAVGLLAMGTLGVGFDMTPSPQLSTPCCRSLQGTCLLWF